MATTTFSKPVDEEIGSLPDQIGNQQIVRITGTTVNYEGQTMLNYPTGYTVDNCHIVSAGVKNSTNWYVNDSRIIVLQSSNGVGFFVTNSAFYNCDCYIVLQKHPS